MSVTFLGETIINDYFVVHRSWFLTQIFNHSKKNSLIIISLIKLSIESNLVERLSLLPILSEMSHVVLLESYTLREKQGGRALVKQPLSSGR